MNLMIVCYWQSKSLDWGQHFMSRLASFWSDLLLICTIHSFSNLHWCAGSDCVVKDTREKPCFSSWEGGLGTIFPAGRRLKPENQLKMRNGSLSVTRMMGKNFRMQWNWKQELPRSLMRELSWPDISVWGWSRWLLVTAIACCLLRLIPSERQSHPVFFYYSRFYLAWCSKCVIT